MLKAYNSLLARRPVLAKAFTSFVLFGAGDALAQKLSPVRTAEDGEAEATAATFDARRTAIMATWGAIGFTPLAHGWYNTLERLVPAGGGAATVKKVLLDQLAWTPVINTLFFFTLPVVDTGSPAAGIACVREKLWATLQVNWVVWPVIQAFNLTLVPLQHRILVVNLASLGWSSYLAKVAHSGGTDEKQKKTLA